MPDAMDLPTLIRSGSMPKCSMDHHFSGTSHALVHFVDGKQDAVLLCRRHESCST